MDFQNLISGESIAAGLTVFSVILTWILTRKKYRKEIDVLSAQKDESVATATSLIASATTVMIEPLTKRVSELNANLVELTTENKNLKDRLFHLEKENAFLLTKVGELEKRVCQLDREE